TVLVCRIARESRALASARSWPHAITLAIIESNCGGMTSPGATPVSTLMPGPAGRARCSIRPGAGAKARPGASAVSRARMACPHAQRPHRALGVGHDLHLDMPAAADGPLQEDGGVPGRLRCLGAGPLERLLEVLGRADHTDAAAAAARGRLDHQRVADGFGRLAGGGHVRDRAATPRR